MENKNGTKRPSNSGSNGTRRTQGGNTNGARRPSGNQSGTRRPSNVSPNGARHTSGSNQKGTKHPSGNQQRRKVDKEKEKFRKKLMIMGFVICAIMLITTIVTTVFVIKLNMVPVKYVVLLDVVLAIVLLWFVFAQKWIVPGIITKLIALIMTVTMIIGCVYMRVTYKAVDKIAGVDSKIDVMRVYVMKDDPAADIKDAKGYKFGKLGSLDSENTNKLQSNVEKELDQSIMTVEYNYISDLVAALYNGEVQAILLNSSYVSIATGMPEYIGFEDETRIIYEMKIESEIEENETNENYLSDEDVFTIYISGIDTRGSSPQVNSNSDVNILMTVNKNTRQIMLLSTPRDYYVPLSISNGVKDKLTHAGGYGIDVSVDTLEMLYEVNIEDYLKINFTGFIDVVDALGGVTVYSEYSFYAENGMAFYQGENEMDGEHALAFARERHAFASGDIQRGKNQMLVIEAIINKLASSELLKNYSDILNQISDCMVTSMTYDEISDLAKFQLDDMRGWDIVKYNVSGYGAMQPTFSAGSQLLSVVEPDWATVEQAKQYLRQIYAGEKIVISEEN